MLRIEVAHTFDVSVAEAFAYITDMKNWPEYWPDFIRIDNPAAAGVPPTVAGDPAPGRRNNGDSQSWISEVGKCGAAAPKRRGAVADDVRERSVRARQSHSRPSDSAHLRQRRGGRTCSSLCGGISARRSLRR